MSEERNSNLENIIGREIGDVVTSETIERIKDKSGVPEEDFPEAFVRSMGEVANEGDNFSVVISLGGYEQAVAFVENSRNLRSEGCCTEPTDLNAKELGTLTYWATRTEEADPREVYNTIKGYLTL